MSLKTLYEDARVLVVDKPAGLPMDGIGGLPVHRLDKDTSGVLLLAKDEQTRELLQKQFQERTAAKEYLCLVEGGPKGKRGAIHTLLARSLADRRKQRAYRLSDAKEGRREAKTEWEVLERFPGYSLLRAVPKTGRKHQIRAHMASLSHPVAGDKLYGFKNQKVPEGLTRHFLHASSLELSLPGGERKRFEAPLPGDLQKVLALLRNKQRYADS